MCQLVRKVMEVVSVELGARVSSSTHIPTWVATHSFAEASCEEKCFLPETADVANEGQLCKGYCQLIAVGLAGRSWDCVGVDNFA